MCTELKVFKQQMYYNYRKLIGINSLCSFRRQSYPHNTTKNPNPVQHCDAPPQLKTSVCMTGELHQPYSLHFNPFLKCVFHLPLPIPPLTQPRKRRFCPKRGPIKAGLAESRGPGHTAYSRQGTTFPSCQHA